MIVVFQHIRTHAAAQTCITKAKPGHLAVFKNESPLQLRHPGTMPPRCAHKPYARHLAFCICLSFSRRWHLLRACDPQKHSEHASQHAHL
eukprot:12150612-Alexandrium_andersonii.AAC.1